MATASWRGVVIARSDAIQRVDGQSYFPSDAVDLQYLRPATHTSVCGWKGTASYYDVVVGDEINANAAWVYRDPKPAAAHLDGWFAFWRGVATTE